MTIEKLEAHSYAPELNRIHFKKGGSIKAPNCDTIKKARSRVLRKPNTFIWAIVRKTYPSPFESLNRFCSGVVQDRKEAIALAREWRQKNTGGALLDGRTLPAPIITVTTKLFG
jgi:hypothetical protein